MAVKPTTYAELEAKGDTTTQLVPLDPRRKSPHMQRIEEFMHKAGQEVPEHPTEPSPEVRLLRAKLVFEEAVRELILEGLGVDIYLKQYDESGSFSLIPLSVLPPKIIQDKIPGGFKPEYEFKIARPPNLDLIADGCADTSVVTYGTLLACGIADVELIEEVDRSNLSKFELPKCPEHGSTMEFVEKTKGNYLCPIVNCCHTANGPYRSPEGKWVKGPQYKPADIAGVLARQMPPKPAIGFNEEATAKMRNILSETVQLFRDGGMPEFAHAIDQIRNDFKNLQFAQKYGARVKEVHEEPAKVPPTFDTGGFSLCPFCKGPLSDEMVKNMRKMHAKGVDSKGKCPNCTKTFNNTELFDAKS